MLKIKSDIMNLSGAEIMIFREKIYQYHGHNTLAPGIAKTSAATISTMQGI